MALQLYTAFANALWKICRSRARTQCTCVVDIRFLSIRKVGHQLQLIARPTRGAAPIVYVSAAALGYIASAVRQLSIFAIAGAMRKLQHARAAAFEFHDCLQLQLHVNVACCMLQCRFTGMCTCADVAHSKAPQQKIRDRACTSVSI